MDAFETLRARGFIQQTTHEDVVRKALSSRPVRFYVGFDPTAESLHVGSLVQLMVAAHLQRAGHVPVLVMGGGTAMVGDPSGKTELRQMLTIEQLETNKAGIRPQLEKFVSVDGTRGKMVDNADWLLKLNYLGFLRDIGRFFSVNNMLSAQAYKIRLEKGLSFIELNYQILQAYDFLELFRTEGVTLQYGGDDQWGNILAGVDLVRRVEQKEVQAFTTPLVTTATGEKMGKTAKGAVWLSAARLSPFEFFQYWLNVDDRDVVRWLKLYTFLSLEEIAELGKLEGAEIRHAKRVLAREVTTLIHGAEEAEKADKAGQSMAAGAASDELPTLKLSAERLAAGVRVLDALVEGELAKSKGEARKLVEGGGVKLGNDKVSGIDAVIDGDRVGNGLVLRVGKSKAVRLIVEG